MKMLDRRVVLFYDGTTLTKNDVINIKKTLECKTNRKILETIEPEIKSIFFNKKCKFIKINKVFDTFEKGEVVLLFTLLDKYNTVIPTNIDYIVLPKHLKLSVKHLQIKVFLKNNKNLKGVILKHGDKCVVQLVKPIENSNTGDGLAINKNCITIDHQIIKY